MTTRARSNKVLVVGASPTGLSAALQLAKHHVKVDIIEKRSGPSALSRAVGIMPESLDKLGTSIKNQILSEGQSYLKINAHINSELIAQIDARNVLNKGEAMIGLPQSRTEEIIASELASMNVEVKYNVELLDLKNTKSGVQVWFKGIKEEKYFDWVIACDGIESTCRNKLNIKFIGYKIEGAWSIADVDLIDDYDSSTINLWTKIGKNNDVLISLPIGLHRFRLVSSTPNCLNIFPHKSKIKTIRRKGVFQIAIKQAELYQKGYVLLAGDAAHCHSPVGGKGMNLGIDDAMAAAQVILKKNAQYYTRDRHKLGLKVIKRTEFIRKFVMHNSIFSKYALYLALKMVSTFNFMQKIILKNISTLI